MDLHPKPKTAYCDCICQLLRAEICRKPAFPPVTYYLTGPHHRFRQSLTLASDISPIQHFKLQRGTVEP